jgi:hypothetical protein
VHPVKVNVALVEDFFLKDFLDSLKHLAALEHDLLIIYVSISMAILNDLIVIAISSQ